MQYVLYSGDARVATFVYDKGVIAQYLPELPVRLPMQIREPSAAAFTLWLRERAIDLSVTRHRQLMQNLLGSADRTAVAIATHMFSVTDLFTCFPEGEFRQRSKMVVQATQKAVSDFILVSSDTSLRKRSLITPNASTDGSYTKTWKYEKGAWWLYKIQSEEAVRSELHISRALLSLAWDAALYAPVRGHGNRIKTKNFVGDNEFFEPYDSYRFKFDDKRDAPAVILSNIASLGDSFASAYRRILLADALFMNTDRHMRNFGVIRDAKTGETLRMTPNFDNNQAYRSEGEIPCNPVMLQDFRDTLGFTEQDREDLGVLADACAQFPYLKEAGEAASRFLRSINP